MKLQYKSRKRKNSPKRKSPKRKSPKRKSPRRKSPRRKSQKRKSPKRKSQKRKSPRRKSQKRKSQKRKSQKRKSQKRKSSRRKIYGGVNLENIPMEVMKNIVRKYDDESIPRHLFKNCSNIRESSKYLKDTVTDICKEYHTTYVIKDANEIPVLIKHLPNIKVVLNRHTKNIDFNELAKIQGIKKLDIRSINLHNTIFLDSLINLRKLRLLDTGTTNLEFLNNLPQLESLLLTNLNITDISPIINLQNLEYLELYNLNITDTSPISNLYNLTRLSLVIENLSTIDGIFENKYLRTLKIKIHPGLDIRRIQSSSLVSLDFIGDHRLDNICVPTTVKTFSILKNSLVRDLSCICKCNIETLYLVGLVNLVDISTIINCRDIISLTITNTSVFDIRPIFNLYKLEILELLDNTNLYDISVIEHLNNLKELYILNNTNIDNLTIDRDRLVVEILE